MTTKIECDKKLKEMYGLAEDGQPRYRVVWSPNETEWRHGRYEVWANGLFVRAEVGTKLWDKYAYLDNKWVLEAFTINQNPEIVAPFSYEPIYVFQDKDQQYLPLNYDVCVIIINRLLNRVQIFKTEKDHVAEFEEIKRQRIREKVNLMNDILPSDEIKQARLGNLIYNSKDNIH